MDHDTLAARLERAFNAAAAGAFDGTFAVALPEERVALQVRSGRLARLGDDTPVDFTLFFCDRDDAEEILRGRADVIEAFMNGRLRADGYLIRVFAVLAMFRA